MPTPVNLIILVVIAFSATLGLRRGPIREGLSLSAWVIAGLIALKMAAPISHGLTRYVFDEELRWLLAVLLIFTPALLGFSLANTYTTRNLPRYFGRYSQIFGVVLGGTRGLAIIFLAVVLGRFGGLNRDLWWHESALIRPMDALAARLEFYLPTTPHPNQKSTPLFTRRLVLQADAQGIFYAKGWTNNQQVNFRLDPSHKETLLPTSMQNHLGFTLQQKGSQVSLHTLRIGNLELTDVAAVFTPNLPGDHIRLGRNLLQRLNFQGGTIRLTLEQKVFPTQ